MHACSSQSKQSCAVLMENNFKFTRVAIVVILKGYGVCSGWCVGSVVRRVVYYWIVRSTTESSGCAASQRHHGKHNTNNSHLVQIVCRVYLPKASYTHIIYKKRISTLQLTISFFFSQYIIHIPVGSTSTRASPFSYFKTKTKYPHTNVEYTYICMCKYHLTFFFFFQLHTLRLWWSDLLFWKGLLYLDHVDL